VDLPRAARGLLLLLLLLLLPALPLVLASPQEVGPARLAAAAAGACSALGSVLGAAVLMAGSRCETPVGELMGMTMSATLLGLGLLSS
jgi:hypothetical protein